MIHRFVWIKTPNFSEKKNNFLEGWYDQIIVPRI